MKLTVRQKLLLGGLLLLLLAVLGTAAVIGYSAVTSADETLRAETEAKLRSVRDTKRQQIEDYFASNLSFVRGLARTESLQEAMADFDRTSASAVDELKLSAADQDARFRILNAYYQNEFTNEFEKRNAAKPAGVDIVTGKTDAITRNLQYLYIAANKSSLGEKNKFVTSQDPTAYSKSHTKHHPGIDGMRDQIGFYDVFLINLKGRIVYSAFKELDFMSDLTTGIAANTGLAKLYETLKATSPGDAYVSDFTEYLASYNDQAAFLGTPIFEGTKQIGILAIQLPVDQLDRVMTSNKKWRDVGLGLTGESFLVGTGDKLMRSNSRLLIEDKGVFSQRVAAKGANADQVKRLMQKSSSIGLLRIESVAAEQLAQGKEGFAQFQDYLGNEVLGAFTPINIQGLKWGLVAKLNADEALAATRTTRNDILRNAAITAAVLLLLGLIFTYFFGSRFMKPIEQLTGTVKKISSGDYSARAHIKTGDEIEALGNQFDTMLDDRINALAKAQTENEQLNDSIVGLLEGVFRLSQRDLTVKVPVREDVTGSLADALNALTSETSNTLKSVVSSANEVESASNRVKKQADEVILLAAQERAEVDKAQLALNSAVDAMRRIESLSRTSSDAAQTAIKTTSSALTSVQNTVAGMDNIRETMRETEKRMKRLSERSQEISSVVSLINTISERTHVLAINANMQAAMAGEAGKGFAVVAAEVQSLAENARQATAQIAQLVNNIQVETSDTIATMNKTVSQVVEGSKVAQQAGQQMIQTQQATTNLVALVGEIDASAQEQARVAEELVVRAESIRASTQKTGTQLAAQAKETRTLVEYSEKLREAVNVFTLPS